LPPTVEKSQSAFIPGLSAVLLLFPACFGDYVATGESKPRPIILVEIRGSVIYDSIRG
jgi:hypothetical protein